MTLFEAFHWCEIHRPTVIWRKSKTHSANPGVLIRFVNPDGRVFDANGFTFVEAIESAQREVERYK